MSRRLKVKRITETKNLVPRLVQSLNAILKKEVLVGIPEDTTGREDPDGGPMTNATLGYIHETGSPAANIPARPFLVPGVEDALDRIETELGRALKAACNFDETGAEAHLMNAGILGSNGAKRRINSNIPPPLTPATIRNRRRGRQTKSRRASEETYLKLLKEGMDPGSAQAGAGIVSLIDSGQLRNAITSVIRDNPKAKQLSVQDLERATRPPIARGATLKR